MNKKFKKIILLVLLVILSLSSALLISKTLSKNINAEEETAEVTPNVTVTPKSSNTKTTGYILPDSSNYIYFDVKLDRTTTNDVRLRYHLEDMSACAGAGDYCLAEYTGLETLKEKEINTHDQQEVKIVAGQTTGMISIYVPTKAYMISVSDKTNYYRQFKLVVDEAINANTSGTLTHICSQNCSNSLTLTSDSNGYYFKEYSDATKSQKNDDDGGWTKTLDIINQTQYEKLVLTNYGTVYFKMYCEWDRWNGINAGYSEMYLYFGATGDTLIGEESDRFFCNHDFNISANKSVTTSYARSFDKTNYKPTLKSSSYKYSGGLETINNYIKVPYSTSSSGNKVTLNCHDHFGTGTTGCCIWVYGLCRDIDAPSAVAVFADGSTSGKIRIGIRFTEVVQVKDTSKVSVIATLNATRRTKFTYVGGSLTDTLYFEADTSTIGKVTGVSSSTDGNIQITSISVDEISNYSYITDLGYNNSGYRNSCTKLDATTNLSCACNIDLRLPKLETKVDTLSTITKTKKVNVTITSMERGKLYYSWQKTADSLGTDKDKYEGFIDCSDKVTNDERTVTITGSSMSGEYYLHILVISLRQKATTKVIGREYDKNNTPIEGLLFDNTDPTVSANMLYESLTARTFDVNATDGTQEWSSGLYRIYAYVATDSNFTDRASHKIWEINTYDTSKLKMRDDVYIMDENLKFVYSKIDISDYNKLKAYDKNYGGTTLSQVFSSKEAAIEYYKFYEYQDMELVQLGDDNYLYLESGSAGYVKASGETTDPEKSQYWIRYKVQNWDYYNSKDKDTGEYDTSKWVYYFYCDAQDSTPRININALSENLVSAIESVAMNYAEHGANNGSKSSLTKLGLVDSDNMPTLQNGQYHYETEQISTTMTLSYFETQLKYSDSELYMTENGGNGTLLLKALENEIINLKEGEQKYFYIGFYCIDLAGNSTIEEATFTKYKYDRRDLFTSECTVRQNGSVAEKYDENIESYNLDIGEVEFTFKAILDQSKGEKGTIGVNLIKYKGETLSETDYSKYVNIGNPTNNGTQITISTTEPGYYVFELSLTDQGTSKISKEYPFYLTRSAIEETANYKVAHGNIVLNNQVFQLGTDFYYLSTTNGRSVETKYYNGTVNPATFSSKLEASKYVTYMEYQDMTIVKITEFQANALNKGGDASWIKADNETKTAKANQYWIIYKRSYWSVNSNENGWVCYYYAEDGNGKILPSLFSDNLTKAVSTVTDYIISLGSAVNLVGEEYTNKYGASSLSENQIHFNQETASATMTGSEFDGDISYAGDKSIYQNTIMSEVDSTEIPLASNVEFTKDGEYTRVFYSYYQLVNGQERKWTEIIIPDNEKLTYKDAIKGSTGTYLIREFGKEGINEYSVYIDKTAPVISISYISAVGGTANTSTIQEEQDGLVFSAKTFTIASLDSSYEKDTFSYVSIFTYPGLKLLSIYYYEEVNGASITLDNGNYAVEIGDRSGNVYSFIVQVNDEDIVFNVKLVDNSYVQASCNRTKDQIVSYVVKLNKEIIDTEYTGEAKKYKKSGYYEFTITDIYGNTLTEAGETGAGFEFSRSLPELKWSYLNSNGTYTNYDESIVTTMEIVEHLGGTFYINTSKRLKFVMQGEYSYSITGLETNEYTRNDVNGSVVINSDKDWDMEIWYTEYPEVKATYYIRVDASAPEIKCTYSNSQFIGDEQQESSEAKEGAEVGDILIPTTINYFIASTSTTGISNLDTVDSSIIRLDVTDKTGVRTVIVYIDDEKIQEITPENNTFETIYLGRTGNYRIVAEDVFGNVSELEFTNAHYDFVEETIDETTINSEGQFVNNESSKSVTLRKDETLYGNSDFTIKMLRNGTVVIKITDKDNNEYFLYYSIESGDVIKKQYVYTEEVTDDYTVKEYQLVSSTELQQDQFGNLVEKVVPVFSTTDLSYKQGKWYKIASLYENDKADEKVIKDGANIYCKFDQKGYLYFKILSRDDRTTVETRCSFEETIEPYYSVVVLSKEKSNIILVQNSSDEIETNENKEIIYINSKFHINNSFSTDITKVEMSYSDRRDFKEYTVVYPVGDDNSLKEFDTKQNGFYSVRITNIFGIVNEYIINRSDVFTIVSVAKYDDNTESRFNSEYTGVVKANKGISFEAYAQKATFKIYKKVDGEYEDYATEPILIEGCYYITFTEEGSYQIYTSDNYGNNYTRDFEIKKSNIEYDDSYITGYSGLELSRDSGYTNQKLTISKQAINNYNIKYISIIFNNNEKVLYNALTQYAIEYDENALINAIGNEGDGIYTIIFRDEFGSIAKKEINYRETPVISVTRRTRTSTDPEVQDMDKIQTDGVWSNSSIDFSTEAKTYIFKINGEEETLPHQFAFSTSSGNGKFDYTVYYQDEYGFKYEIEIHLLRQTININFDETMTITEIDSVDTTRNNIKFTYSETATCTYRLDSGEEKSVAQNQVLYHDGTYRITAVDKAGNTSSKTIRKDTVCEFAFVESKNSLTVINGSVCNANKVEFKGLNNDSVSIKTIYFNGVKQENTGQIIFSDTGKYGIIITDKIGNETLFEFYNINHSLKDFEYSTPDTYKITEIWYDSGDNQSVTYMEFINHTDLNSSFYATENGDYTVVMQSTIYNEAWEFSFTIDNRAPEVSLVGCAEGDVTIESVSISGYEVGDTVYIYKDGILDSTTEITSKNVNPPVISEGGNYKIVVENQAGVTSELSFTRTHIPNGAGSALIIAICVSVVIAILVGMLLKNKQKYDD